MQLGSLGRWPDGGVAASQRRQQRHGARALLLRSSGAPRCAPALRRAAARRAPRAVPDPYREPPSSGGDGGFGSSSSGSGSRHERVELPEPAPLSSPLPSDGGATTTSEEEENGAGAPADALAAADGGGGGGAATAGSAAGAAALHDAAAAGAAAAAPLDPFAHLAAYAPPTIRRHPEKRVVFASERLRAHPLACARGKGATQDGRAGVFSLIGRQKSLGLGRRRSLTQAAGQWTTRLFLFFTTSPLNPPPQPIRSAPPQQKQKSRP